MGTMPFTDVGAALGGFVGGVEKTVRRQDQMRLLGDAGLLAQIGTAGCQRRGLLPEENRVEHDTVADHIHLAALEDS